MKSVEICKLPIANPGTARSVTVLRYGEAGSRPKAYLQAGLHADEAPGFVVMHELIKKLDEAEHAGLITGEIILVPAANPIGLAQWRDDILQGRFDFTNSINFNRQHLDLVEKIAEKIADRLSDDEQHNKKLIRSVTAEILDSIAPEDEAAHLKHLLFSLSHDADLVLDLHCDHQALMHVYLGTPLWPEASDLPAQLGAEVTLLAADSGGTPFDEANSRLWWNLAEKFPHCPLPSACLSATVELRGICDTDRDTAQQDAQNLFVFLQRRGLLGGTAPPLPRLRNQATPLTGVDYIKAKAPGVLVFFKNPGDRVEKNEIIAEIINPLPENENERVSPVVTATAGILFARIADRFARTGRIIAKVAGDKPLRPAEGNLLTL